MICPIFDDILEPLLGSLIAVIGDSLNGLSEPLSSELSDKLYPEKRFESSPCASVTRFTPISSVAESFAAPFEYLNNWVTGLIFGDDGILSVPISASLVDGIDLVGIRIVGFDNFTYDALSLVGNHTFQTKYTQDYVGLEFELAVGNDINTTDSVLITTGLNDLTFEFALLMVIENSFNETSTDETLFAGVTNIITGVSDSVLALEVASLSLKSSSIEGVEVSGVSQQIGLQKMINEIFDAITFMFGGVLMNAVNTFLQTAVRGAINDAIAPLLTTCSEKVTSGIARLDISSYKWAIAMLLCFL